MTRTCDLRFRKPSLYPPELWDLVSGVLLRRGARSTRDFHFPHGGVEKRSFCASFVACKGLVDQGFRDALGGAGVEVAGVDLGAEGLAVVEGAGVRRVRF